MDTNPGSPLLTPYSGIPPGFGRKRATPNGFKVVPAMIALLY